MNILSPAKVNLRLEILKKREDGYHEIFSLIQGVGLYDEIEIEILDTKGIVLEIEGRYSNFLEDLDKRDNLAYRGAQAFIDASGIYKGVRVHLYKRIPVAAGLGGGSSNAASVLMGLNSIFEYPLSEEELISIGRGIGADVPFFFLRGPALASGVGDMLERVELPELWYVIVWPRIPISTRDAYESLKFGLTKKILDINIESLKDNLRDVGFLSGFLCNDLEKVGVERYPEIGFIKEALCRYDPIGALMSGSGSSVFGVFVDRDKAEEAYTGFKEGHLKKGWAVFMAKGL